MFSRTLRLPDVGGVPLHVDLTWVLAAVLVGWSFLDRFAVGGRDAATVASMGLVATVGFFLSILAHELGHALQARSRDIEVRGITLFLLGGVTEMRGDATTPRHEFVVAAIGPWVSLVLAAVLGLVTAGLDEYVAWGVDLALVTGNLAWINLAVAAFNLVPGAPLDGGRVLRALLWQLTGDRLRATRIASTAGQVLAIGLVGSAAWLALRQPRGWVAGAWLVVIAVFVWVAAAAERRHARLLEQLGGRRAGEVPVTADDDAHELPSVPADAPLPALLLELQRHDRVAIVDAGRVLGVVDRDSLEEHLRGAGTEDERPAP